MDMVLEMGNLQVILQYDCKVSIDNYSCGVTNYIMDRTMVMNGLITYD